MENTKRLFLNILAVFFLLMAVLLIVQNLALPVPLQIFTLRFEEIPLGLAMAIVALLTGLAVLFKSFERLASLGALQQKARRELERKEVSREEADARVRVLENKVQTLEKALSEALKH